MTKRLEIASHSALTGERFVELAARVAEYFNRDQLRLLTKVDRDRTGEAFDEIHKYIGKIVAIRSVDDVARIEKSVWSFNDGKFYHESYVQNAVGVVTHADTHFLPLTLEAPRGWGSPAVEYVIPNVVHPRTFDPLLLVEVFDPR